MSDGGKEKFQPKHAQDDRTPSSEGQRLWELFALGKLNEWIYVRGDDNGTVLVDDKTGKIIVDSDGDATGN